MNVSRLISLLDLKVTLDVKSLDYYVLLTQMIVVGIQNILPINAIGQKVLSEEALESLEKAL
jgi:hypothetical protein